MPSGLFDSLGTGFGPVVTYAFAAIVVFVLLLVVLAIAKRSLRPGLANSSLRKGPRLAIIDVAAVDQRRKLVLLRRDEVEHLVLIGGQNDLVVEGGILRTPAAAQAFPAERPGHSRFEPAMPGNGTGSDGRPAVVAPDPRMRSGDDEMPRPASPLRRPVPQQRPKVSAPETHDETVEAPVEKPAKATPPIAAPAPLIEPAIVAEVPEPAPRQPSPPAAKPVQAEPVRRPSPPEERPAPSDEAAAIYLPERAARIETSAPTVATNAPAVSRERPDVAPPAKSPTIPAFLQRGEPAPEAREEMIPPPEPIVTPPPVSTPPAAPRIPLFERANLRQETPSAATPQRAERPPVVEPPTPPRSPVIPNALPAKPAEPAAPVPPPAVEPVILPRAEEPLVEPQRPSEPERLASELSDDGDRRPLSVRSFASAIQSRRTAQDLAAQPRPAPSVERPQDRVRPATPSPYPVRETPPPAPAPSTSSSSTDDGSLEDALSRELDSDLGLLDWADETRATSEKSDPPKAPPSPEPKAERRPTLEEEMERLLSDFDFGSPRR